MCDLEMQDHLDTIEFGESVIKSLTEFINNPDNEGLEMSELTDLRDRNIKIISEHKAYVAKHRSSSSFPLPDGLY